MLGPIRKSHPPRFCCRHNTRRDDLVYFSFPKDSEQRSVCLWKETRRRLDGMPRRMQMIGTKEMQETGGMKAVEFQQVPNMEKFASK
jgi:hypothetical protein